jgi:hypothetical protein
VDGYRLVIQRVSWIGSSEVKENISVKELAVFYFCGLSHHIAGFCWNSVFIRTKNPGRERNDENYRVGVLVGTINSA